MHYILIASMPDKAMKGTGNKALIKINEDIFLNHQIKNLLKLNQRDRIYIICAFESKKIIERVIKNKRVVCIQHPYTEYSNIGESLKAVINHIPDNSPISIMNLSMVIDPILIKNMKFKDSAIVSSSSAKFKSKIGCTLNPSNKVEFVFYDLPHKICEWLYISKKDNARFKRIINRYIKNNMYLFEVINTLIHYNISIDTIPVKANILHLNSPEQLTGIKHFFRKIRNVSAL
jgi:hypothetical protein